MAKREVKIDDNNKITIRIPVSFLDVFRAVNDRTEIKEYIESTTYRRQVSVVRYQLKMEAGIIREMFRPIVNDIIQQVGCLLKTKQTYEIKNKIMVGGLSESEYVQKSMQTAFPDINVMIPEDPELAVMEGAVLFGFNPSVITRIGSENM
jgi:molecular chaperone DnaK (HSP70)